MFSPLFPFPLHCLFNVTSGTSFFFCFFTCTKENQYRTEGDKSTYGGTAEGGPAGPHICGHMVLADWHPTQRGGAGNMMEGCGGSRDVKFDLWKDEMVGDQRAGAGWKGLGAGWNNATNGGHVEEKWMRWGMRESKGSSGRQGDEGEGVSWKILFLWLERRTGALIYNVYHGSMRDFHTYKMEQHHEVSGCQCTAGNRLWGTF